MTPCAGLAHQSAVGRLCAALAAAAPAGVVVHPGADGAALTWHGDTSGVAWAVAALAA